MMEPAEPHLVGLVDVVDLQECQQLPPAHVEEHLRRSRVPIVHPDTQQLEPDDLRVELDRLLELVSDERQMIDPSGGALEAAVLLRRLRDEVINQLAAFCLGLFQRDCHRLHLPWCVWGPVGGPFFSRGRRCPAAAAVRRRRSAPPE